MAIRIQATSDMVVGDPVVQPTDKLFWFNSPRFLLYLINFVLFQNSFQVAFYVYTWGKFGINSCFHKEKEDSIIISCMGFLVLILSSYVTLPLYALVTLMGSKMKPTESRHKPEDSHRASSTVRPEPEHVYKDDQAMHTMPSPSSSHGQALHGGRDGHDIGMKEVAIQIPATEAVELKDSFARRSRSCR